MKTAKLLAAHIFVGLIIMLSAVWFRLPIVGMGLLALVGINLRYRKIRARVWARVKKQVPLAGTVLSGFIFIALGVLFGITTYRYGVELISVPSSSMKSAIHPGSYILVNKLKPGPRRFASTPGKYFRMAGTNELRRGDIVLFNFPEGDTILANRPNESYYYLKRHFHEFDRLRQIRQWGQLIPLKVEDRPRFVKRLTGLPGDTFSIEDGDIFVNSKKLEISPTVIKKYRWTHTKEAFAALSAKLNILDQYTTGNHIEVEMTIGDYSGLASEVKKNLKPALVEKNVPDRHIFPFNTSRGWNTHHMGPIYIPSAGDTIVLTTENLPLYLRAIRVYEENKLEIKAGQIYLNGKPANQYCFKMNYYWAMGDNRPHSFDSRFWGFLPENHIIGTIPKILVDKR